MIFMRTVGLLLALLFALSFADDVCSMFATYTPLDVAANRDRIYECMRSIHPFEEAARDELVDTLLTMLGGYVFLGDLRAPEDPRFAVQGDVDLRLDLEAEISRMRTTVYPSSWEMYLHAERIWLRARDAHTLFHMPACYQSYLQVFSPVPVCGAGLSANGVQIKVCQAHSEKSEEVLNSLSINPGDVFGQNIDTINGQPAFEFVRRWADHRAFTGRDPAQRFELYMERSGGILPGWNGILSENEQIDWSILEDDTSVFKLTYRLTNGYEFTVPIVAYMQPEMKPGPLAKAIPTPMSADVLADKFCKRVLKADDTERVSGEVSELESPERTSARLFAPTSEHVETLAAAKTHHEMPAELVSAIEKALPALRHELSLHAEATARNPILMTADDAAEYIDLHVVDDVCIFWITNYAPSGIKGEYQFFQELYDAMLDAKRNNCGTKGGRKIVFDIRSNPGGAVVLLSLVFDSIWPHYTPHHQNNSMMRFSPIVDLFEHLAGADADAVRERFSFHPTASCNYAETASCPNWWQDRKSKTVRVLGGQAYEYSQATSTASQFWEKPAEYSDISDWCNNGDGSTVMGTNNSVFGMIADIIQRSTLWSPRPDMTVALTGPITASCGAHTITRIRAFNLGTVATTGGDPTLESYGRLMAALVPGGNTLSSSYYGTKQGVHWPHKGSQLTITTMASLPYTTESGLIVNGGATTMETPMEFVYLPPQVIVPFWQESAVRRTEQGRKDMVDALKKPGMPLAGCIDGTFNWASYQECPISEGVRIAGRLCDATTGKYTGECVPALCEFGWERFNGKCVNHGAKVVSLPPLPFLPDRPLPPTPPTPEPTPATLPAWVFPLFVALSSVTLVLLGVFVWLMVKVFGYRKHIRNTDVYTRLNDVDEPIA